MLVLSAEAPTPPRSSLKNVTPDKHRGHPLKLSISPPLQGTLAPPDLAPSGET